MATGEAPDSTRQESPYGQYATLAGQAALRALDYLADDPVWRDGAQRCWLPSDDTTFASTVACITLLGVAKHDVSIGRHMAEDTGKPTDNAFLRAEATSLHAALPLTEGEREWLWSESASAVLWNNGSWRTEPHLARNYADAIKEAKDHIIYEAGRQRVIVGQEVLDAWWTWRRAAFEFEGQESVDLARQALRGIGDILIPRVATMADAQDR